MPIQTSIQLKTTEIRLNEQELARRFIFKEILKVILLATSGFRLGQTQTKVLHCSVARHERICVVGMGP